MLCILLLSVAVATGAASTASGDIRLLADTGLTPCYEVAEEKLCLPHLYIVGLAKAGTSALWAKLIHHHQVWQKLTCPSSPAQAYPFIIISRLLRLAAMHTAMCQAR